MAAGRLEIEIAANTQRLVKGMDNAEKTLKKSVGNMTKVVTGFAAIFVGGSLINKIKETNSQLDQLGKTSSKLNIGVENLQGLHLAAEEAGVSTNTLDMAIQRMTRRVAEAAKGTGEAVGALNELGLEANALNNMTPDQMLRRIADSMQDVTNQSDRVRLAMKLFDSEGVALVNMLANGSKGLDDVAEKANKFGLVIGGNYIKAIEKSNDAWNIAGRVFDTVGIGISVALADAFNALSTQVLDSGTSINLFKSTLDTAKTVIYNTVRVVDVAIKSISASMTGWATTAAFVKMAITDLFSSNKKEIADARENYAKWADLSTQKVNKLVESIKGVSPELAWINQLLKDTPDAAPVKPLSVGGAGEVKEIAGFWEEAGLAASKYYNNISNNTVKATSLVNTMNSTISSGITNAFRQAMDGATNFGDIFENILKDIVAQLINVLVVQQAVAASLNALGFGTATVSPVPAVAGARAEGGPVSGGSTYLVGENGPELFTARMSGSIIPNDKLGGGESSVNVTVVNNNNSNVSVNQDDSGNIEILLSAVADSITRGTGDVGTAIEQRYNLSKV